MVCDSSIKDMNMESRGPHMPICDSSLKHFQLLKRSVMTNRKEMNAGSVEIIT